MRRPELLAQKQNILLFAMHVGTRNIKNSVIQRLIDMIWRAVEKVYALPDDFFEIDDENAIIEE